MATPTGWRYCRNMVAAAPAFGNLLREWRQRRRLSQLELACEAEISTRHLSFVETGRSMPSREMVLRLADQLAIPMRERNVLLVAAGYAPVYSERLLNDPALDAARKAIDLFLEAHSRIRRSRSTGIGIWWPQTAPFRVCTMASPISCSSRRSTDCG